MFPLVSIDASADETALDRPSPLQLAIIDKTTPVGSSCICIVGTVRQSKIGKALAHQRSPRRISTAACSISPNTVDMLPDTVS